jgi:beta-galactosidase
VVLTEKRETTGKPESIRLTADRAEINADGEDVSVLRVEVLDKEGRAIPTADNMISFKVSGEGALIGVGNGDPNCQESDKEPKRSLFSGLAQVIVQSSKTPGTITVEAFTGDWPPPKLPATRITIMTKKVDLRPTVG